MVPWIVKVAVGGGDKSWILGIFQKNCQHNLPMVWMGCIREREGSRKMLSEFV